MGLNFYEYDGLQSKMTHPKHTGSVLQKGVRPVVLSWMKQVAFTPFPKRSTMQNTTIVD